MSTFRRISTYGLAYLLWVISFILGGLVLFQLREAILTAISVSTFQGSSSDRELFYASMLMRTVDQWSYLALGIVLIVLIVFFEHHYRTAVESERLRLRFFRATAIEFGLLFVANFVVAALNWVVSSFSFSSLF